MKSLNVVPLVTFTRSFLLGLVGAVAAIASGSVFAEERLLTKSDPPTPVLVLSMSDIYPGTGFSTFNVSYTDIPTGTLTLPKKLIGIQWSTTYYPKTIRDAVELCYYRPFSSERTCQDIQPSSSGTFDIFNDQAFGHGSKVVINHSVLGGEPPFARPAGVDSVTFKYQY